MWVSEQVYYIGSSPDTISLHEGLSSETIIYTNIAKCSGVVHFENAWLFTGEKIESCFFCFLGRKLVT